MRGLELGELAPDFELPDTEGRTHRLSAQAGTAPIVIVFTCNHCPYALAWQERIRAVADDYRPREVRVFCINSNDADRYPADSYHAMCERFAAEQWPMPYLHDESQSTARAFGARTTPDVFVLDGELRLRYRGAPDEDYDNPAANALWLREALDDLLAGVELRRPETEPVGCSIKWRP